MTNSSTKPQKSRIEQAEDRLETELDQVATKETITADDLEQFRQSLPTDPFLAQAVKRALPFPFSKVFEYVEGSDRQAPYWRVSPDRSQSRSEADRENRERFAAAAKQTQGVSGTKKYQDREIPLSAALVAEQLSGKGADSGSTSDTGRRALKRVRELLD